MRAENEYNESTRGSDSQSFDYYRLRSIHKFSGYFLWIMTKYKLVIVTIIDSEKIGHYFEILVWVYLGIFVIGRVVMEMVINLGGKRFRHNSISYSNKKFDSKQIEAHRKLLEQIKFNDVSFLQINIF
jgi:hypothetical protein